MISEKTKILVVQVKGQKAAIVAANNVHIAEALSNIAKWEAENAVLQADIDALTVDIPVPMTIKEKLDG